MSSERRQYTRLAKPLDGSWSGASDGSVCRIADISRGGCFINTLAEPAKGERTIVTIGTGGAEVVIEGRVVSLDPPMRFVVEFDPLTHAQIEVLTPLLGDPLTPLSQAPGGKT